MPASEESGGNRVKRQQDRQILAWILLVVGVLWLMQSFSHIFFRLLPRPGHIVFPLVLLVAGVVLLFRR